MKLQKIHITNYRNINDISVCFHPLCNYIIGENNLGKSNFLSLLNTICNGFRFDEKDYSDTTKAIEVNLEIKLLPNEQGFFGDNFSPEDSTVIRLRFSQSISEHYLSISCIDSNEAISQKQIKKINFLIYETTSIPSRELRLTSQKGMGLLMSGIISRFITESSPSFLNDEQVSNLTEFINGYLMKIRSFHDYSIKATISPNAIEMLTNLFYLSDGDRKIETTGSGVQYMAMATINILCQIMELYTNKSTPFEDMLYIDDNGKRLLPLVLSIDEPEVHLHPYLQRSLIGYYNKILHNEDHDFTDLLSSCFGIDGINGQLIVVTHSTDVLIGDYRHLIRFYKDENKVSAINGYSLRPIDGAANKGCIKKESEKHLIMHFPEIKEAFYSKCAIIVEGETEYGCIHTFAKKMAISLDDCGICVINAKGEGSIKPLCHLLQLFAVPSVVIYDKDVRLGKTPTGNEFFTSELCFEIEIIKMLYKNNMQHIVREIALALDKDADSTEMDTDFIRKHFNKMGVAVDSYPSKKLSNVSDADEDEFCNMYSAWYMAKKGILLGRIIGEMLPAELIPDCYRNAIKKAQEVSINA